MSETYDRWAWYVVIALALILHLISLSRVPLSSMELSQALASLDTARELDVTTLMDSVLLYVGNALLFAVFGAGNGIARFIPMVAGIGLALLPYLWRRYLGHKGALAAAGVLLISPLLLFAARRVEGTVVSTFAVALLLTAWGPFWSKGEHYNLRNIFIILGVSSGLLSGSAFYDLLLAGFIAFALWQWLRREPLDRNFVQLWWRPVLTGLGVAILVSIGLGLRWSGWDGVMVGLSRWLSSWSATSDVSHFGALLLYEPFTLILTLLALGFAWRQQDSLILAVGMWALLVLLMMSLRGALVTNAGTVILPLAFLAGYGIENTLSSISGNQAKWAGLHVGLGFLFFLPAWLGMTQYANGLISPEQPLLVVSGGIVLLALQALLAFLFSLVLPAKILWRSVIMGASLMCLYVQAGFSMQLNFVRPTSALEPAVVNAGSPDMAAFRQMIADIAGQRGLRQDTLVITVVDADPDISNSVRWVLRDYQRVQLSPTWPSEAEVTNTDRVVITPESLDLSAVAAPGWKGMRFTAIHNYLAPTPACRRTTTIDCTDWVNWYLYRTSPYPQSPKNLILWVNQDAY